MAMDEELRQQIHKLEITTRKLVQEIFLGQYRSLFKGRGLNFREHREYFPGDDVRLIDWNASARMQKTYIKETEQERELNIHLLVDCSPSLDFTTQELSKREIAAKMAAVIIFAALKSRDKVGLLRFSGEVEKYIEPRRGRRHSQRLLQEILTGSDYNSPKTDLPTALNHLLSANKKRSVIFLIADYAVTIDVKLLRQLSRRHDVSAFLVYDPFEREIPDVGWLHLHDLETQEPVAVNTSSAAFRQQYQQKMKEHFDQTHQSLISSQVDFLSVGTNQNFIEPLRQFFLKKKKLPQVKLGV